jgi:osmoprotectant transport system substrate-binding protein
MKLIPLATLCSSLLVTSALALPGPVTVGSKLDGEGVLLCQIVKLLLEQAKFTVTDRCATGNTPVTRKALLERRIDLYPEYSGNVMFLFPDAKLDASVGRNSTRSWYQGQSLDSNNGVVWLRPAPANNTFALAIPKVLSEREKLRTMSDLARYIKAGGKFKLAATFEFLSREDGLKAFEKTYGFKLDKTQSLITSGGSSTDTQEAAALGISGANAALTYGTDGALEEFELIPLIDDKAAVAVYAPLITVRREILTRSPEIKTLIAPVWNKLNTTTLIKLNAQVTKRGISAANQVAKEYLVSVGVLK